MTEATTAPQTITAEDLYRFELALDPRIAPDGRHVIYGVQRVDKESEKKYTNLWLVPTDGSAPPRQFTVGDHADTHARWSPDGEQIAFLSNRKDEKQPQIYLLPFAGGEARPLTDLKGTIGSFSWSPDGLRLLLRFREKSEAALEREKDERLKKLGVVERHITRVGFRLDGAGFLPDERWHIWTVEVDSGEATQLTEGARSEMWPTWSPDGSEILFISNRSEDPDLDPYLDDVFLMPAEGGEARKLETPVGLKMAPVFSPDGRWISYVGREGRGNAWKNNSLWLLPADGSAPPTNLTEAHDLHIGSSTLGDVADLPFSRPVWTAQGGPKGGHILFQVSRHGNVTIHAVDPQHALESGESEIEDLVTPQGNIGAFTFDRDGQKLAYLWSDFSHPNQVYVHELGVDSPRQLTHLNEEWLGELELGEMEEVWFEGADGNRLQGWILKPPGFNPQQKYPSILEIHGGPWLQYGNVFMHEFYTLAAQRYVVYFTNPRGGQGYGETHGRAIHLRWGGPDYADVMSWADYMADQPYIDTERMGITGGSYGGYMTLWTITHTNRFRAAVAQRVVSNAISFWGSSDFGYLFEDTWADRQPPWEKLDAYWEQSPMKYIANARTPTLIIHSEQDLRCNLEQATQVFVALKKLGVDTELVLFPDESHGLSRGGRTDRRVARLEHMMRWFRRYLKDDEEA